MIESSIFWSCIYSNYRVALLQHYLTQLCICFTILVIFWFIPSLTSGVFWGMAAIKQIAWASAISNRAQTLISLWVFDTQAFAHILCRLNKPNRCLPSRWVPDNQLGRFLFNVVIHGRELKGAGWLFEISKENWLTNHAFSLFYQIWSAEFWDQQTPQRKTLSSGSCFTYKWRFVRQIKSLTFTQFTQLWFFM